VLSTATGLPKVAKMAEGAQHFFLATFGDVGHLRSHAVCHLRSDPPPKHAARVPGNKIGWRSTVAVWLMDAGEVQERHMVRRARWGRTRYLPGSIVLGAICRRWPRRRRCPTFLLAIFADVGHLRRPIIRASPDSVAERRHSLIATGRKLTRAVEISGPGIFI
jgi:hypothetical protein